MPHPKPTGRLSIKKSCWLSWAAYLFTVILSCPTGFAQQTAPPPLLEVLTSSQRFVGLPIHWSDGLALLLEPSGNMIHLKLSELTEHHVLPESFTPQSANAAKTVLMNEFGSGYETASVGPYVIIAQRGSVQRWRERFRILVAGYYRYFEVRGWKLRQPDFPLSVIVLPSRAEFDRYCEKETGRPIPNLLGYYFPKTNRCVLYEVSQASGSTDWNETERTIVHEAVHQLAYNTGVHERLSSNPLWVVEGLATMLEEKSVFESRGISNQVVDRINTQQMRILKPILADSAKLQPLLAELIRGDDLFKAQPLQAYALAWGLSFYLTERMPAQFSSYTQQVAKLPKLRDYHAAERERDFSRAFEGDINLLSVQLQRFYSKLE